MKIRMGFVSNSSSSSFVIYRKNTNKTEEEIFEYNKNKFITYYDEDYINEMLEDDPDYIPRYKELLLASSLEYGDEQTVETIVYELLNALNLNIEDFEIIIGDY